MTHFKKVILNRIRTGELTEQTWWLIKKYFPSFLPEASFELSNFIIRVEQIKFGLRYWKIGITEFWLIGDQGSMDNNVTLVDPGPKIHGPTDLCRLLRIFFLSWSVDQNLRPNNSGSSLKSFENVLRKFKISFVTVKFQHEDFPLPGSNLDFFKVQIRIWPWMTFASSYHFNLQEPSLVSIRHFKKCQRGLNWKRHK